MCARARVQMCVCIVSVCATVNMNADGYRLASGYYYEQNAVRLESLSHIIFIRPEAKLSRSDIV